MNKIFLFGTISLSVALIGCGGSRQAESVSSNAANASSNKESVSFGIYDMASSGPKLLPDAQPATVSVTKMASNTGGGGGGGRNEVPREVITAEAISLTQASSSQTNPVASDRKIVRNAELSLESEQPEEAQKRIAAIAESKGGFVVESQQNSSDVKVDSRDIVQMTIRVPADRFTETVSEIRATAKRVIVETVKGQDVTEEFIDIEARLKAKKALELQFMEIMKRATSVDDALSVQSQLANVRGEIEKIEGRKRFLENQASFSTIKIRLQTPAVFAASSAGFSDRLAESFENGFDVAISFTLTLVTFVVGILPVAVFIGLPAFLIGRFYWRRRNRPMSVVDIAKDEIRPE